MTAASPVPLSAYWVQFDRAIEAARRGGAKACVEAASEQDAMRLGTELTGAVALSCKRLPYPANPRLNPFKHPEYGVCPAFCYLPDQCAGNTSCPQNYSCTE